MPKTRSKSTDAIEMLKEDHAKVKKAFKELSGAAVDVAAIQRDSAGQFQGRRKKKDD